MKHILFPWHEMAVDSPTCIKEPGWLEPQYYARPCSAHTSSIQESSLGPDWDKVRDAGRWLLRPKVIVAVGGSLTFFAMRIFSQPLQIQRLAWRTWKNAHIVTSQEVRVQSPKFQEIDLKWDRTGRLGVSWQNLPKLEKPFRWFAKKVKFHSSLLAICLNKFLDHKGQHLRWKDVIMFEQPRSSWYELHFILSIHKGKDMSCEVWDTMGSWISWLAGQWICIRFRLLGLCLNSRNPL